jgi:hypothetical protein
MASYFNLFKGSQVISCNSYVILIFSIISLSGCTIGNGRICGPQTPAAYCDAEAYQSLMYPKPYLQKWEKPGWTAEARMQSSADCGGGFSDRPSPSQKLIRETRQTGESEYNATVRLRHEWQRCMIKKGFRYIGECYDNEISRASPACGAP